MTTEIKVDLNKNAIEDLQELIQINFDSAKGCQVIAEEVKSVAFRAAFLELALERNRQGEELAVYVAYNHEEPQRSGTYAAAIHRCWMRCRSALTNSDLHGLLSEAEYGEEQVEKAYKAAVEYSSGRSIADVLIDHYEQVKKSHIAIRDLKDAIQ